MKALIVTKILLTALFCSVLCSCTYLKYSAAQAQYARIQNAQPSQLNVKHMLDRETYFLYGKTFDKLNLYTDSAIAISAFSNRFFANERVDTMFVAGSGTHFGLNLPEGSYTILVFADRNNDASFDRSEVVGSYQVTLNKVGSPDKVRGHTDIHLTRPLVNDWVESFLAPDYQNKKESLFYPTGTIRSLNEPIFDDDIATLGMYDPASFLEYAPTMFYALEEDTAYKVPVVFVHGIGGSARSFLPIIEHLDRSRYKPWFFFYPSGADLEQLAEFFYQLYLSGDVIPQSDMPMIVVAHSMGGLIVREAINKYQGEPEENKIKLFISIASPFGGHPSAKQGEEHGLITLPSWRDLNPDSKFIEQLYRKPLPEFVSHHLLYAYKNADVLKVGQNSDGVVPLSSQLFPQAQKQAVLQFGYDSGHIDILNNAQLLSDILYKLDEVENLFPESHLRLINMGGFDVELSDQYSPITQYIIHTIGKYLVLMAKGYISPANAAQNHFIQVLKKEEAAISEEEKGLIMFIQNYPGVINTFLLSYESE